jgi:hypothetical protein
VEVPARQRNARRFPEERSAKPTTSARSLMPTPTLKEPPSVPRLRTVNRRAVASTAGGDDMDGEVGGPASWQAAKTVRTHAPSARRFMEHLRFRLAGRDDITADLEIGTRGVKHSCDRCVSTGWLDVGLTAPG